MSADKATNLQIVRTRIAAAQKKYGRQHEQIKLIAVSKKFTAADIMDFYALGLVDFGENYIQEWLQKLELLAKPLIWHIIGNIQSNKTKHVAQFAAWVHTVDKIAVARRLNSQRPPTLPPLNVCIEVNISGDAHKHGIKVSEILPLAAAVSALPRLKLRGLMCVPTAASPRQTAEEMAQMQALYLDLKIREPQVDTLSMGMSADLELAVKYGSTALRIGSALFGERQ